jgi:hypothetical protein
MDPTRLVLPLASVFCWHYRHFYFSFLGQHCPFKRACKRFADIRTASRSSFHFLLPSSSLLLGAHVLSRPTNDLRKVLSRDPDHDVHRFFFSLIPTIHICSRNTAIYSGKREEGKLEQREEEREKWIEEHAAGDGEERCWQKVISFHLVGLGLRSEKT